ncbi:MAG: hypothetical protein SGI73_18095 [Chloroflexota bacterium]|nr:hypothetical protein [Chloroflexota bacterium]
MNRFALCMIALSLSIVVLAACGSAPAATPTSNVSATPRQAIIPTFAFVQPTVAPQIATAAASGSTTVDLQQIERGRSRYEVLACWACHGENAEGGSAMALNDLALSEDEFITYMRTAITLEDGTIHQFATNLLSASGGRNLYAYLQSLRAS